MALFWPVTTIFACIVIYTTWWLYRLNRNLTSLPPEALRLAGEPWTEESIRTAWDKFEKQDHDFTKNLPPKQNRRYVVSGGSGLVGGWIVEHLILRGENPRGIRIVDLAPPRRENAIKQHITHISADISDRSSVDAVFSQPWPPEVASLPLTVFHTAAYIHAGYRTTSSLSPFINVNIQGTQNVMNAAKAAGCDVFIATSSASIALKCQTFFSFLPWQKYPDGFIQVHDNAEAQDYDAPLHKFAGSYAYTKARADKMVRDADDERNRFRTGTIRPGHSIYGHGDENPNSLATNYLLMGGFQTWLSSYTLQLVSAQNVSLAHLLLESRIHTHNLGGRGYSISDPNPPVRYGDMELLLSVLAHPSTPIRWPHVAPVPVMLLSYVIECYVSIQRGGGDYFLGGPASALFSWLRLPVLSRELSLVQPAMFNYANLHVVYDGTRTVDELGYRSDHTSLEGLMLVVKEWNENVEARIAAATNS